jgi:predicted membrane metal-binding protein
MQLALKSKTVDPGRRWRGCQPHIAISATRSGCIVNAMWTSRLSILCHATRRPDWVSEKRFGCQKIVKASLLWCLLPCNLLIYHIILVSPAIFSLFFPCSAGKSRDSSLPARLNPVAAPRDPKYNGCGNGVTEATRVFVPKRQRMTDHSSACNIF